MPWVHRGVRTAPIGWGNRPETGDSKVTRLGTKAPQKGHSRSGARRILGELALRVCREHAGVQAACAATQ